MVGLGILLAFVLQASLRLAFRPTMEFAMSSIKLQRKIPQTHLYKTLGCEMMNLLSCDTVKPLSISTDCLVKSHHFTNSICGMRVGITDVQ